jgi:hypothetical protein
MLAEMLIRRLADKIQRVRRSNVPTRKVLSGLVVPSRYDEKQVVPVWKLVIISRW